MSRVCAIHQPNFMPWLGYFHKMEKSDVFVFLDNVDIVTGSAKAITNRIKIKTRQGAIWLTVPIKKGSSKKIADQAIDGTSWKGKALKTIDQAYSKASNFESIMPVVEQIINCDSQSLAEFNIHGIQTIARLLKINTPVTSASQLPIDSQDKNERIVQICKYLDASFYYSGQGAKKYHNESVFREAEIRIEYAEFIHPVYPQLHGAFLPGLSAIDYLFNTDNLP